MVDRLYELRKDGKPVGQSGAALEGMCLQLLENYKSDPKSMWTLLHFAANGEELESFNMEQVRKIMKDRKMAWMN